MSDGTLGVVLDAGSQNMKAGFVGEPSPRVMLPTTVGRFRREGLVDGFPLIYCGAEAIKKRGISQLVYPVKEGLIQNWDEMEKLWHHVFYKELHVPPESVMVMHAVHPLAPECDKFRREGLVDGFPLIYCGAEAIKKRGISQLVYPVKEGLIQNWDEMEKLWHHVFYKELHVPPESVMVMHAVHPLAPECDKQRMAEIMFESFAINGLYMAKTPSLILNAYGRTTGIVWENGYSCSYAAPVFEGFPLKHATVTSPITGKMLTERLQNLLFKAGYSFTTPFEIDLLDQIKKDICYLSQDYNKELAAKAGYDDCKAKYYLPDGQHILLGEERFSCPEVLFQPEIAGLKCRSIIDTICHSIDLCDLDYKSIFFNNIVCSGGSSLITGLEDRLTTELAQHLKKNLPDVTGRVEAMSMRQYAAWAGGSMLASLPNLKGFWLTKEEYEDSGSDRVKYKFF